MTPNNKKTRKMLLECENCGRVFERASGADFEHIKCKCMCAPEPEHRKLIEYNGKLYMKKELAKKAGVSPHVLNYRLNKGMSIEQAMQNEWEYRCVECSKWFKSPKLDAKYCSDRCRNRQHKNAKPMIQLEMTNCIVCNRLFIKKRSGCRTCSQECRKKINQIDRNKRYKDLKKQGDFDYSVNLINVYESFRGICQYCHKSLSFESDVCGDDYPSIDHIIPISKGGTHTWDNVQLLCRRCNYMKSDKILEVTQ